MKPTVIWKDVTGYEGLYQVSNTGQIKSLRRKVVYKDGRSRIVPERILKQEVSKSTGYVYVNLCLSGNIRHCSVHRLVANAFIPNVFNLPMVNHKDEDRQNNRVDNLEWITNIDNLHYSDAWNKGIRNRRSYKGTANPFYGKRHTKETRKRLSDIRRARL